jgi:light-regulated signal transduction histidine kinase (bacteriophytochrome)
VTGIASISRDITDRKLAAEMLRRSAAELARSNVELEQFAYIASHDLQEPLRKIQAFGDMLASSAGDALGTEERDYLSRMCRAAARMRTLIDDLLDLSRVATRGRPFEPVDLSEVAREVLEDLETRLVESGAAVRVGDLPRVMADPTQMRQLLQNLVGNALKYRKPDVAPEILVERLADCGPGQVAFAVRDNGIGFDPKYADRIFQPFQRLHGRGEYEGTGMGLAICRKIVERHEGTIVADARPGAGAVFRVVLPFCPFRPGAVDGESR